MGKRSNFERVGNDFYRTQDLRAHRTLLPHLPKGASFAEVAAGWGDLVGPLMRAGHDCVARYDIDPCYPGVVEKNALDLTVADLNGADLIITNPPWTRTSLHPIIMHLCQLAPTWLLFDSDWAYTDQSEPYMKYCTDVVSVGRLIWIPFTKMAGKENCSWYRFDRSPLDRTIFHRRVDSDANPRQLKRRLVYA
ncbi:hypothetical protein FIU93_22885 [Labrenzia sp. THAF35]|uniref:hypothetical protein n=1 Tax=Labrenzia sp. THAF35 TaxID=2587854 RepID=UPI0012A7AB59|nr:hypothetical protein [Labrenzia sp. THAF35]QFT69648.1 hypothetical protein FIU93_22885 [Labrenzia sp. THAF35]